MANMLSWLTGREDQAEQPSPVKYDDGQPSLRAYNPTPSERVGNWIQDLLMAGGAKAYPAGHIAHGVRDLLSMSPLGIGMSAADVLHAKSADDPMGAAAAAIGMVPGLKPEVKAIRQGIRAYHGSPHDFDRFDISKIGSGEGAQSYGHGLYFAENEGVARAYREQLASNHIPADKLAEYYKPGEIIRTDHGYDLVKKFDRDSRAVTVRSVDKEGNPTQDLLGLRDRVHTTQPSLETFNSAMRARGMPEHQPGSMYEVNINAKPEQFLDWDKPITQQQSILDKLNFNPKSVRELEIQRLGKEPPGGDLYWYLNPNKAKASAELSEAGIPGIRYLDQGSRLAVKQPRIKSMGSYDDGWGVQLPNGSTETGFLSKTEAEEWLRNAPAEKINPSSNYVLFNDQLVDIMRKYGLAAPAAAGAVSYAMQPQETQAGKAQAAQFQQPKPLSDKINQMIDSLQWGDQWQGRMRLPLERKVNTMLGESIWPPLR